MSQEIDKNVNNPKHYNVGSIETIKYFESLGISEDFALGNALKYLSRYKFKEAPLQDLKKAKWYIDYLVQFYSEAENNEVNKRKKQDKKGVKKTPSK
jgi:hypothetical protein